MKYRWRKKVYVEFVCKSDICDAKRRTEEPQQWLVCCEAKNPNFVFDTANLIFTLLQGNSYSSIDERAFVNTYLTEHFVSFVFWYPQLVALNRSRDQHVGFQVAAGCQFLERQIDSQNDPGISSIVLWPFAFVFFRGPLPFFFFFFYNLNNRGFVIPTPLCLF